MTKILSIPSSINQVNDILNIVDGFILSIDGLSVNGNFYINIRNIDDIIKKIKEENKEVFISLNKNVFNSDLDFLKETLVKLNHLNIDGVLYYDISVLSIVKNLKLNLNLIWSQEHLTTNYLTANYYKEKGVKGVYLSSEITLKEILEIRDNTDLLIMVPIFGYLPMFNSKRHIVKNYLETFNINDYSKINYMEKENKKYPIIDDYNGTTVYSSNIMCGLEEYLILKEKKLDYVTINSFNISNSKLKEVIIHFNEVNESNKKEKINIINKMFDNMDKGFLYKETIYRVKKDEEKSN